MQKKIINKQKWLEKHLKQTKIVKCTFFQPQFPEQFNSIPTRPLGSEAKKHHPEIIFQALPIPNSKFPRGNTATKSQNYHVLNKPNNTINHTHMSNSLFHAFFFFFFNYRYFSNQLEKSTFPGKNSPKSPQIHR